MGGSFTKPSDQEFKHDQTLLSSTPEENSRSSEPELQPPPKTSFTSLPLELRQKIWLLTLQPRVLYLHIHQRIEPPPFDEDGFIDGPRKTTSISFTVQVATPGSLPSPAFHDFANYVAPDPTTLGVDLGNDRDYYLHYANVLATRPWGIKNSRGPVALEVCSESREVAIKRYELAFAGTDLALELKDKEEWNRKAFGEKRIWVDFERDTIFVDAMWRVRKYSKCAQLNPLGLLRKYAPEESKKIRRLALGTCYASGPGGGEVMKALRGSQIPMSGAPVWQRRSEWFWGFDGVEELLVDDHFKERTDQCDLGFQNRENENEFVAKSIAERMREGRKECPEWIAEVPKVKVVRGQEWLAYVE